MLSAERKIVFTILDWRANLMALHDPVAVYNAANNVEAHLVRNALLTSGVEAHVTEDVSQVGTWAFGLLPEIHKPQVWVERQDIE